MGFWRFYGHFAAAYGTLWFILLFAALVSQSHIDAGGFGLFGFPLLALLYAFVRMAGSGGGSSAPNEIQMLRERIAYLEGALGDDRNYGDEHDAS